MGRKQTMTARGFALFATAIGTCAIAWGRGGIVRIMLPEADAADSRRRIVRRFPEVAEMRPAPGVDLAIADIVRLIGGGRNDLGRITLDMSGVPEFDRSVYEAARTIPPGATLTYGAVARRIGEPGAARAVGQALGRNPFPIVVPCHRVLGADGKVGGFSAPGGRETKLRLLSIEGAHLGDTPTLFDSLGGLPFRAA
jgi:methylated-DNA-[protein]-cysteine S-methyltransferase